MNCRVCAGQISTTAILCPHCHSSLLGLPAEPTAPQRLAEPVAERPASPPTEICPRSWCAQEYPVGTTVCPRCFEPVPVAGESGGRVSSVHLVLPGGVTLGLQPTQVLVLGRESPDARIAASLDPYEGVSRRHAELAVSEAGVSLTDTRSTNGTFLDSSPTAISAVTLAAGRHQVRLGGTAVLGVEVISR